MKQYYSAILLLFSLIILIQQNANASRCSSILMRNWNNFKVCGYERMSQCGRLVHSSNTFQIDANVVLNNKHDFTKTATFIALHFEGDLNFNSGRKISSAFKSRVNLITGGQLTSDARRNSRNSVYTQKLL